MSDFTSISIPENLKSDFFELQEELDKVEKALLDIQKKKQEVLQYEFSRGIQKLETLANKINSLTNSLEKKS